MIDAMVGALEKLLGLLGWHVLRRTPNITQQWLGSLQALESGPLMLGLWDVNAANQ